MIKITSIIIALFFLAPGYIAKASNYLYLIDNLKSGPSDSLRKKKKAKHPQDIKQANDFEKDEYTYIDDIYNPFCKRLAINNIVDGYADKVSYDPGDTVKLYLNTSNGVINHKLYLYDVLMNKKDSLISNTFVQTASSVSPWENYGYNLTCKYIIPSNLSSGMYNFGKAVFFIVKRAIKNADITIVYPSNTEAAYNNTGGKSLYNFNSTNNTKVNTVTFKRPLSNFILTEIQQHSYPFLKWLKTLNNYSIQYIQDIDLNDYSEIANSKLLVVIGSYWT